MANSFGLAFYKSQQAAKSELPLQGTVLITVTDADKKDVTKTAREFDKLGFRIKATDGTYKHLTANAVRAELILKMNEVRQEQTQPGERDQQDRGNDHGQ